MSDWFKSTSESERRLSEERLLLSFTEMIAEALERRGVTRAELADRVGVSKSEISQRLRGSRNLSLRTVADMLHALDFAVESRLADLANNVGDTGKTESQPVFRSPATTSSRVDAWPTDATYYRTPLRVVKGAA